MNVRSCESLLHDTQHTVRLWDSQNSVSKYGCRVECYAPATVEQSVLECHYQPVQHGRHANTFKLITASCNGPHLCMPLRHISRHCRTQHQRATSRGVYFTLMLRAGQAKLRHGAGTSPLNLQAWPMMMIRAIDSADCPQTTRLVAGLHHMA